MEIKDMRAQTCLNMCDCCKASSHDENMFNVDEVPLSSGGHTSFIFGTCRNCGGIMAFPKDNMLLFIDDSSDKMFSEFYSNYGCKYRKRIPLSEVVTGVHKTDEHVTTVHPFTARIARAVNLIFSTLGWSMFFLAIILWYLNR
jgi:hypothetical protein